MLSALRARQAPRQRASDGQPNETKSGVYIYNGNPGDYHEWEFRTQARHAGTKDDDKPYIGPRVLEGLRDDAYLVAKDFGLESLARADGVLKLIEKMKAHVFPSMEDEAQLLYHHGQKEGGMLSRQSGESMFAYVGRRRRWWDTMQQLDKNTVISENIRADLLLQLSGLDHDKQLLIKTSVQNRKDFEEIAKTLVKQHPKIHARERRREEGPKKPQQRKPFGKSSYGSRSRNWGNKKKFANIADEGSDEDDSDYHELEHTSESDGAVGYHADEDEETSETIQLEVLTAYMAQHNDWDSDTGELADACVEQIQCELMAYFARGKGKGKGVQFKKRFNNKFKGTKGVPTLEDRREKLKALKKKSKCKLCGKLGHWAGDPECSKKERTAMIHISSRQSNDEDELTCEPCRDASDTTSPASVSRSRAAVVTARHVDDTVMITSPVHIDDDSNSPFSSFSEVESVAYMASRFRMDLGEDDEGDSEFEYVDPTNPPGSDTKFTYGQYKGWTFIDVLQQHPGYAAWSLTVKDPNPKLLGIFVCWVREYFVYNASTQTFRLLSDSAAAAAGPVVQTVVPGTQGKRKSKLSELKKDPEGPCRGGCDQTCGTFAGSNVHIRKFTCYKCGHSRQESRECEEPRIDPEVCEHLNTDNRGSTQRLHKTFCKDCKTVVEIMPQEVWKERKELGRQAAMSSHHTAHVTARAIIQENVEFSPGQATQVATLTNRLQMREVKKAAASGKTVSATQLIAAAEDAIDTMVQSIISDQVQEQLKPQQPQETPASGSTAFVALLYKDDDEIEQDILDRQLIAAAEAQLGAMIWSTGGAEETNAIRNTDAMQRLIDSNYFASIAPLTESDEEESEYESDWSSDTYGHTIPSLEDNTVTESEGESEETAVLALHDSRGFVVDDPDSQELHAYPLMKDTEPPALPWVDIMADEGVWVVLDEGCNSTCHGSKWAENAEAKFRALGWKCPWVNRERKTYKGVGKTSTVGKRRFPMGVELSPSGLRVPGTLASHELDQELTPLLLSLPAQAQLGIIKNVRAGTMKMADYEGQEVKLCRDTRSQLAVFCISKLRCNEDAESLQGMRLDDTEEPIGMTPATPSPDDYQAYVGDGEEGEDDAKWPYQQKRKNRWQASEPAEPPPQKGKRKGGKEIGQADSKVAKTSDKAGKSKSKGRTTTRPVYTENPLADPEVAKKKREEADVKCLEKPVELVTIGLQYFESGNGSKRQCRKVKDWLDEGNKSSEFDIQNKGHRTMLYDSFKKNYPDIINKYKDSEIMFFDAQDFSDAAEDPELRGHIGWHWKNMETTIESTAFKEEFPTFVEVFDDVLFRESTEKVLGIIYCKSGRHRSECLKKTAAGILRKHGVTVTEVSTSKGKYWNRSTCGGTCENCAEGTEEARTKTSAAIHKAVNLWIKTENKHPEVCGLVGAYAAKLKHILSRKMENARKKSETVEHVGASGDEEQEAGEASAPSEPPITKRIVRRSVKLDPAPKDPTAAANKIGEDFKRATPLKAKSGPFAKQKTPPVPDTRGTPSVAPRGSLGRGLRADGKDQTADEVKPAAGQPPEVEIPGVTRVGLDSASDRSPSHDSTEKSSTTVTDPPEHVALAVLDRLLKVFKPGLNVQQYADEIKTERGDKLGVLSMIDQLQLDNKIDHTTIDTMIENATQEFETSSSKTKPDEDSDLRETEAVYHFPNERLSVWIPEKYWGDKKKIEEFETQGWDQHTDREEYILNEIRADLRKFCHRKSMYGVTIPDDDVFNIGLHALCDQDYYIALALGACYVDDHIVIPEPEVRAIGDTDQVIPKCQVPECRICDRDDDQVLEAEPGSSRPKPRVWQMGTASLTARPNTWRVRAAAARAAKERDLETETREANLGTQDSEMTPASTISEIEFLKRKVAELSTKLDTKQQSDRKRPSSPDTYRAPTPEKRVRGAQSTNIYRISRMSDDEYTALFDDKDKNFKTYVGPMKDKLQKVRVDGKVEPWNTYVKCPPNMCNYTKYTLCQWAVGEPWEEVECQLWMNEGRTFDADERPLRLLVFAVPPESEQYNVAYMHTVASPLASRSGIMTRKQHQNDLKNVAMVNNQDKSLMAFLGDKVRSWTPKVMALGVVLACLATSLAVSGDQTSVTGWANPEWQDTVERQISTEDPDLLILDPGFSSNYSAYDPESLEWVQKTCERRLDAGKSILILDSAFTQRWNEDNWKYLLGAENALTGETATRCCCRGDLAFVTDSVYLNNLLYEWSRTDDKHWCPRSIDDTRETDSGLDKIVTDALDLQLEDVDAYCAFPAEMLAEESEERGPIDCIEGPEDIAMPETGDATKLEEEEQNLLDEMPLPGMPQDEAERRRLWAGIPRRARAAIRRMHRMIGHKPKAVLLQILKGSRASEEYINAAKSYRCDDCAETESKVRTHPVKPPSLYAFNYELQIDVLETYDDEGTRYSWLSIVDCGTTFHIAILVRVGGSQPTSRKCYDKFVQHWVKWAGWPSIVTVDRGTHNRGVFTRGLAAHGVYVRPTGLESPEQLGRGERHGGLFKKALKRIVRVHHIVGKVAMKMAGAEATCEKNDMIRRGGFSPSQWVLGKAPRGVGHLLDEEELGQLGVLEDRTDPATEFAINASYRLTARKAFVQYDCGKRAAKLMLRNSGPLAGNYSAGDLVCFRKEQGSTEPSSVWSAPARIIGFDNKTVWVSCENLPVATALDKLRPCTAAEVLAYQVLNREAMEHGPSDDQQRFLDHRKAASRPSDREAGDAADSEDSDHEPQADASGGGAASGEPMEDAGDLFASDEENAAPGVALSLPPAGQPGHVDDNMRMVRPRLFGPSPEESRATEPEQEEAPLVRQWERTGTVGPGVNLVARMHPAHGALQQQRHGGDADPHPPLVESDAEDDDLDGLVANEGDSDDNKEQSAGVDEKADIASEAHRRIRGLPPRSLWSEKLTDKHLDEYRVFFANRVESNASKDYLQKKARLRSKYAAKKRKEDSGKLLVYDKCRPETQAGLLKSRAAEWNKWQQFYAASLVSGEELQKLIDEGYQTLPTQWIETDKNAALRVPGGPEVEEKLKSRLVGRGDLEDIDVRSDSPTCETEAVNLICSFAASRKLTIKSADITNAYFQGEELDRLLLFKQPKGGLPGVPDGACMIARVPVYGTKDAGRGFWKRLRTVITTAGFRENYVMRALYHYTNEEGRILAMMGTHVDDVFWANEPEIDHLVDKVMNEFNVGKREQGSFRFCGDEFTQDSDFTIRKTCTSTAKKLKPVYIDPGRKSHQDAHEGEKAQMKSVAASLGWCARQVGPQYAYRVSKAKKSQPKATVKDVKDMNKLVEHVVETADRGLTFRAGILDWDSMDIEMITVTDASHANEEDSNEDKTEPYRSQGARLHLLASPGLLSKEECSFHLIGHQSTEVKRVCRATVQAEAYAMQNGTEEGDRLRAAIADVRGVLDPKHWEATASASMRQIWITDCKSVYDSLVKPKMAKMSDKRLGIEIAALRQSIWRTPGQAYGDPLLCDDLPSNATDVVRWIDTDVMLADPLTKAMDATKLMSALDTNTWSIVQPHESIIKKRAKQLARSKTGKSPPVEESP